MVANPSQDRADLAYAAAMTVLVPAGGVPTWDHPQPDAAPGPRIPAGLMVAVLERRGAWVQVRCTNGWTAWTDDRLLEPTPTPTPPPQPWGPPRVAAAAPAPARPAAATAKNPLALVGTLAASGAALVAASAFLPWFSALGVGVDGWDVPLRYLVAGTEGSTGLKIGPFLLLSLLAFVPLLTRRRLGMWPLLLIGAIGTNAAILALARVLRPQPHPDPGVAIFVAFAGGVLIVIQGWRQRGEHR